MKRSLILASAIALAACGSSGPKRPADLSFMGDTKSFVPVTTPRGDVIWKSESLMAIYATDCAMLQPWVMNDMKVLVGHDATGWYYVCDGGE